MHSVELNGYPFLKKCKYTSITARFFASYVNGGFLFSSGRQPAFILFEMTLVDLSLWKRKGMNNCNLTPVGLHPHRVHFLLVVLYMDPLSNQAIPTLISQFLAADRNRTHLGREILQYGREEQSLSIINGLETLINGYLLCIFFSFLTKHFISLVLVISSSTN